MQLLIPPHPPQRSHCCSQYWWPPGECGVMRAGLGLSFASIPARGCCYCLHFPDELTEATELGGKQRGWKPHLPRGPPTTQLNPIREASIPVGCTPAHEMFEVPDAISQLEQEFLSWLPASAGLMGHPGLPPLASTKFLAWRSLGVALG
jgi:hypothetical protein